MPSLDYAEAYQSELEQAYPYTLNFGALYATPNNGRFKWDGAQTIQVPTITVKGRIDGDRDEIVEARRKYSNSWTPLNLSRLRSWGTLIHPADIIENSYSTSIANITQVYNVEQKFPEMDAYTVSKIYADYIANSGEPDTTTLTKDNILTVINGMRTNMTAGRVPTFGRILYITPDMHNMLTMSAELARYMDVKNNGTRVRTDIEEFNGVEIAVVPSELMKTLYDFTEGWDIDASAGQINMMLIHPSSVITPIRYNFAQLDPPSAGSQGKWEYYEESIEDVFVLPQKIKGIQMNVTV